MAMMMMMKRIGDSWQARAKRATDDKISKHLDEVYMTHGSSSNELLMI